MLGNQCEETFFKESGGGGGGVSVNIIYYHYHYVRGVEINIFA